jgi:hypothetical protein
MDFVGFSMGNRREESPSPSYSGPVIDHVVGVQIAQQMSLVHIDQDLRLALALNHPGSESDWQCIGAAVSECEKDFFSKLEVLIGKILPKERFDISYIRDRMREDVKEKLR